MDGSRRSAHANAYFTGFGAAKRVVFFDTLLQKLAPGEVEAVLAHELGHFKHRHVAKRIATMFALSLVGFALLGWLSTQAWFYTGLGVRPSVGGPNDAVALLLFLLVAPVFGFFVSPLVAAGLAPPRVRGRCLCLHARRRPRSRGRAAQAARRQRLDADARPAVRALLLFAPAGLRAARRPALRRSFLRSSMTNLLHARCQAQGVEPMGEGRDPQPPDASQRLAVRNGGAIEKTFSFKNYYETIAFVNALAWICNTEDHHPDLAVTYNRCVTRFSTHSVGRHFAQRFHLCRRRRMRWCRSSPDIGAPAADASPQ